MRTIDHLNRYVSNVDKFITFYRDVLNYELIDKGVKENGKNFAILKGEEHELFISEMNNFKSEDEGNFRHMGYNIGNVDKLLEVLKLIGYVEKKQQIIVKPFSKQFYIKDPDGFEIDLIQWTDKQGFYDHLKAKNSI